ncbi:MAG: LysM peptidoglycan-binding domain-containing protein [Planctomycetia bacterium]|jgi:LysM repeat protein
MNSLKTMATAVIMAGVLYGVYIFLNRTPDDSNSPEMAKEWNNIKSDVPDVNVTPPTAEITPGGLAEVSPEQAFSGISTTPTTPSTPYPDTANVNVSLPTGTPDPTGVQAPVSPPIGSQYDPNNNTTSGTTYSGDPTVNPNGTTPAQDNSWQNTMAQVQLQLAEKRLADAHRDLSQAYFDPNTTPENKKKIEPLLDQLAGTVVYSKQHLLEKPYKVNQGDTLETIARQFNVPVGLIAKINGLNPSTPLQAGQDLKIVQGPFSATIDLSDHELTLTTADGRYAGRFPIGVGPYANNINEKSVFMVINKSDTSPRFEQGQTHLGRRWIGLKNEFGLHGTDNPGSIGTSNGNGAISLGDKDIADLFDILSFQSKVTIQP